MCKKNNIYFLRYFKSLPLLKDFDYESHSVNWLPFEDVLKQLNFDLGLLSARDFPLIFIQQKSLPFLKGFACDPFPKGSNSLNWLPFENARKQF
jgi:hypothetical protein